MPRRNNVCSPQPTQFAVGSFEDSVISIREVCKIFRKSEGYIRKLTRAGYFKRVLGPRSGLVSRESVLKVLNGEGVR